jgi:prefoldin subunit 5
MRIEGTVNVYHHVIWEDRETNQKLDAILRKLQAIQRKEEHMSAELDALEVAVNENTTLDGSIILLVQGLAAQIEALKDDPIKLAALAASLKASSQAISDAIQANTPAP